MSSSLQLWRRLPQLSRAMCCHRGVLVRHLAVISAGPLLSVCHSGAWGGSTSHRHHTPSLPAGMIATFSLGLLLCNSERREDERRFIVAAKEGDLPTLRKLLSNGVDVNCRHPLGWTALHTAVVNSNWSVVRLLVESGADVNMKDEFSSADRVAFKERVSRLSVASVRDREFSSKINHYVSYSGFTPLHYAVVMEEEGREMVRYLLDHGADPTTENNRGFCPIKYSTKEETRKLLQEYASQSLIATDMDGKAWKIWSHDMW